MYKKKQQPIITCYQCRYAYLMQSRKGNPIVARCERRPDERQVASTPHTCPFFALNQLNQIIHPLIPAK